VHRKAPFRRGIVVPQEAEPQPHYWTQYEGGDQDDADGQGRNSQAGRAAGFATPVELELGRLCSGRRTC
jgi:hypothetical protein